MACIRVLALSVDIGAGHRRAAEAIGEGLAALRPGSTLELLESLQFAGGELAKELYFGLLEDAPELWGDLYQDRALTDLLRPLGAFLDDLRVGDLAPVVRARAPDVILAMHPIACGLAGALRRSDEIACPAVAVLTDFDAHPAWVARGLNLYLVPTEEVARGMRRYDLGPAAVEVTGFPLRGAFATIREQPRDRAALGLEERLTVLLLGGGLGLGPIAETAELLATLDAPIQLVVIAGGNAELRRACEDLAAHATLPIHVTGMVENIWDHMQAADIAVGKSGGSTCAELLAVGVPLVVLAPIPGQERANCDALVRAGAAIHAPTAQAARDATARLVAAPEQREAMRQAALQAGRPEGARDAGLRLLRLLEEEWPTLKYQLRRGRDTFSTGSDPFRYLEALEREVEQLEQPARPAAPAPAATAAAEPAPTAAPSPTSGEPSPASPVPAARRRSITDELSRLKQRMADEATGAAPAPTPEPTPAPPPDPRAAEKAARAARVEDELAAIKRRLAGERGD